MSKRNKRIEEVLKGSKVSQFGVAIYCREVEISGFYWTRVENQALSYGCIRFEKII